MKGRDMPDLATAVNAAFAYAHEPADLATALGPPSACFRIPATRDLLEFAQKVETQDELTEVLRRVAPTVGVPDPYKAAVMALLCGTLVEWGADPQELSPLLLARLPAFLAQAESVADRAETEAPETLFAANPDGFRAWQSLSLMLLPTMAVLARGAEFRKSARRSEELVRLIESLRERNREADFVAQTLSFVDGVELVVLHPGEGKGFRVELEAVHTNAHLFTLLHGALIDGGHLPGRPIGEELFGVATGAIPHEKQLTDDARWQFYTWRGLRPDGSFAGADMSAWLFVEDPPTVIPEFEGERVVVLGPPVLGSRMWDSNFFANIHDSLRSAARVVGVLTPEEVIQWNDRIMRAQR
jgi:hypothetical protein